MNRRMNRSLFRILVSALCLSSPITAFTQTVVAKPDTASVSRDSTRVSYYTGNFESVGKLQLNPIDTGLAGFQNYDPIWKHDRFFATLGNIGQNYRSLVPFNDQGTSGFDYGIHTFEQHLYRTLS